MSILIEFETDNDAFHGDNFEPEVKRILENISERVGEGEMSSGIYDINGNKVGEFKVD